MEGSSNPPFESKSSIDETNTSFDLESMDPEQRQKVEDELKTELAKVGRSPSSRLFRELYDIFSLRSIVDHLSKTN